MLSVKPGDLVKYKPYPHKELQHLIGLVTSISGDQYKRDELDMAWVMWSNDRPRVVCGTPIEEWIDELDVISNLCTHEHQEDNC